MFGEDKTITPIITIEAKIQARVAKFLALKDKLVTMVKSPILTISDKAKTLLSVQEKLEGQLKESYDIIEKVKEGVYSYSDIIRVSSFAVAMEDQIKSVDSLEKDFLAKGGVYVAGIQFPSLKWLLAIGAGILGLFYIRKKL